MTIPAPLQRSGFRSLWLAGLVSDGGDWLMFIALPLVVYRLTGSALGTSVAFLAELAPGIVLGPLAGTLADRCDRRTVMLVVTALQAATLPALLLVGGGRGLAIVYAVIVGQAALAALFDPAKNALVPELVPGGELVAANSLLGLEGGLARLVGGPLGGVLLAAGDLRAIVIADALSFLAAAVLITRLPAESGPRDRLPEPAAAGRSGDSRGGAEPSRPRRLRSPPVRAALTVTLLAQIAQGIFLVLFVVFVARRLQGGPGETGLLRGVQAVGAIAGGLFLAGGLGRRPAGQLVAGGAIAFGALSLAVWNAPALTTAPVLFVALFVIVGAPGVVMETGLISFLQRAVAAGERGRVFAAFGVAANAGAAVGMLAAGLLTAPLGLMAVLDAQAALYLSAGALAALTLAGGRRRAALAEFGDARPGRGAAPGVGRRARVAGDG